MPKSGNISKSELDGIPSGNSKCVKAGKLNVIIYNGGDGNYKACLNKCVHFGGDFVPDLEDIGKMKCTMHGWKLDPATMSYCPGSHPKVFGMELKKFSENKQAELTVARNEDGSITITDTSDGAYLDRNSHAVGRTSIATANNWVAGWVCRVLWTD